MQKENAYQAQKQKQKNKTKQKSGGTITPLCVWWQIKWHEEQIPPLNFFGRSKWGTLEGDIKNEMFILIQFPLFYENFGNKINIALKITTDLKSCCLTTTNIHQIMGRNNE